MKRCPESGFRAQEIAPSVLRCLDRDEVSPLLADLKWARDPKDALKPKPTV